LRTSLDAAVLPCSYPPTCRGALPSSYHRWFRRRPRFHAVAWFPPTTMNNLSTCPKTHFPVALDSSRETALYSELHLLRSLLPLTSPFAVNSGCPSPTAVTLLGFSPLKSSLTTPRSLNPPRPLGPEHWPSPQTQGLKAKARDQKDFQDPEGPLPPPWPGGTRLTLESAKSTLSAVSSSCMKPARTTSRWSLLLPWPWIT